MPSGWCNLARSGWLFQTYVNQNLDVKRKSKDPSLTTQTYYIQHIERFRCLCSIKQNWLPIKGQLSDTGIIPLNIIPFITGLKATNIFDSLLTWNFNFTAIVMRLIGTCWNTGGLCVCVWGGGGEMCGVCVWGGGGAVALSCRILGFDCQKMNVYRQCFLITSNGMAIIFDS